MKRRRVSPAAWMLIAVYLPLCWLWMQIVHEFGHVIGAVMVGGRIEHVELHPLTISRTDVDPNPSPAFVVWAGPLFGVAFPLVVWVVTSPWHSVRHLARFFAGFCLVANGAYIGSGTWFPVGDAAVMLRHHSAWPLAVFGATSVVTGLLLWHGQGPRFGLGENPEVVSNRLVGVVTALLFSTIAAEVAFSTVI